MAAGDACLMGFEGEQISRMTKIWNDGFRFEMVGWG